MSQLNLHNPIPKANKYTVKTASVIQPVYYTVDYKGKLTESRVRWLLTYPQEASDPLKPKQTNGSMISITGSK